MNTSIHLPRLVLGAALLVAGLAPADPVLPGPPEAAVREDIGLVRDLDITEARVPARATLETLLRQHDLPTEVTAAVVGAVATVFNPRHLHADQPYRIARSFDGLLREFRYQIDADRLLRVVFAEADGAPAAEVVALPRETSVEAVAAEVTRTHSSLIGALDAAGEHAPLALQLADIFGGEIDFNSEIQLGDRFDVLFERHTRDGQFLGYGPVQAAVVANDGRRLVAVRFVGDDGKAAWYDENGRSLKRQFLKSPLPFDYRVTSRFSYRRLHPISGTLRPHLGVDFGAPIGTRVVSVAAGTVVYVGVNGGAGRMVRVRHAGGYETAYLHLSGYATGIRTGVRVAQGDLLGYVGMSGDATGPHLDYRIMKNGTYVNPLTEISKMPKGEPVAPAARDAFLQARDAALALLADRIAARAAASQSPGSDRTSR